jgi:hypothetical protein
VEGRARAEARRRCGEAEMGCSGGSVCPRANARGEGSPWLVQGVGEPRLGQQVGQVPRVRLGPPGVDV